jgi:hypothetical protein
MSDRPFDPRIRDLAARALTLAHYDVAKAIEILRDWTDLSFETALAALEEVAGIDHGK